MYKILWNKSAADSGNNKQEEELEQEGEEEEEEGEGEKVEEQSEAWVLITSGRSCSHVCSHVTRLLLLHVIAWAWQQGRSECVVTVLEMPDMSAMRKCANIKWKQASNANENVNKTFSSLLYNGLI